MKELQERAEQLQCENDHLQAQVEQRRDLDERDAQDSGPARHPAVSDKRKKPIALDDVDTQEDDELSSSSSPNLSLVKRKSNKDRTRQRHSHHSAFSDSNGSFVAWRLEHIPRSSNRKADALATVATFLLIKETVLLPIYYQSELSITTNHVNEVEEAAPSWLTLTVRYLSSGELPRMTKLRPTRSRSKRHGSPSLMNGCISDPWAGPPILNVSLNNRDNTY